ncbi:hypothetical protein SAMN07250955_11272 [Arboricoccus pini]|uniref:Neutral zinc metallopeptidase n=1 Tax=Arboricoccus pini TaxID=1963835 RepID=A0A212RQY8_9PROT|nr:neutral zinc metallopeptidase [Arboricoccus pini]SNB74977.1 hypothetical protein SAMN07250955_11272 [Arboricoccus pini]
MRWQMGRRSDNVEDRRGQEADLGGGPGLRIPLGKGLGGGIGTIVIVLFLLYMGVDPSVLFQDGSAPAPTTQHSTAVSGNGDSRGDTAKDFASVVLADTEDTWGQIFKERGERYQPPTLVIYDNSVNSGCGAASSGAGPFYCPTDQKLYLDLSFFDELSQRFGASGDFADAYVIAHEVGHHVQNLLGISDKVQAYREEHSTSEANHASVMLELQADCLAGVWAAHADRSRHILESGDLQEALSAASAVGDDRLQRRSGGGIHPDSFTHGTSEQRTRWFQTGFQKGTLESCNTFSASNL